jgi:hypothetical protein
MRIIFIHGFGETENIFDKIAPALPGEHIFINLWEALGNQSRPDLNIVVFAKETIQKYSIGPNDIIVGHSLGGKIAWYIKHFNGNRIVQIASWTSQKKIVMPIKNIRLIYWLTKRGLFLNRFAKKYFVNAAYKNKPSREIYEQTFDRLSTGNKNCVINQLRLVLEPVKEPVAVAPDLRIHAKKDKVIRCPDESFEEVSGDHFTLWTEPEKVIAPIRCFLEVDAASGRV